MMLRVRRRDNYVRVIKAILLFIIQCKCQVTDVKEFPDLHRHLRVKATFQSHLARGISGESFNLSLRLWDLFKLFVSSNQNFDEEYAINSGLNQSIS